MSQLAYQPNTTLEINNFDFLKSDFTQPHSVGVDIDHYYSTDYNCCLLKARLFSELWCFEVAKCLGVELPVGDDLTDKIKVLANTNKLPSYIIEAIDLIRIEGNRAVHVNLTLTGQWYATPKISIHSLNQVMLAVFDIAQHLFFNIAKNIGELKTWQEPNRLDNTELVSRAINGNKEATFNIAKSIYNNLISLSNSIVCKNKKAELKSDLAYWLNKAHLQGHNDSWLLYAQVYQQKLLDLRESQTIHSYFKQAVKLCQNGEAAYQYALFLKKQNQVKRAWSFVNTAASKGYYQAIQDLQDL